MAAARVPDQADFDLERFVSMFDEAMVSQDPRVMRTLRDLMMIVTLTRPESDEMTSPRKGPLRRAFEDMNHLWKRLEQMEEELRQMHQQLNRQTSLNDRWPRQEFPEDKYSLAEAAKIAQSIDQDVMQSISRKINSGNAGLNLVPPKGKLYK